VCYSETCKVNVCFHGAGGTGEYFGQELQDELNFAASNKLIMIFPSSTNWDWYADVDEPNAHTLDGYYNKAINAMICRVTSEEATSTCAMHDGATYGL